MRTCECLMSAGFPEIPVTTHQDESVTPTLNTKAFTVARLTSSIFVFNHYMCATLVHCSSFFPKLAHSWNTEDDLSSLCIFTDMNLCQGNLFTGSELPHLHLRSLSVSLSFGWNRNIAITAQKGPFKHTSFHYFLWRGSLGGSALLCRSWMLRAFLNMS